MSTGGGEGKKRLFARPTALLVDSVPSRITMPVPPPFSMRLPDPEPKAIVTDEEPLAGPARLFIGAPREVAPLKVRAGLERRTERVENEMDPPSAGPHVHFPLKRTPFDREPPPLPNRWGVRDVSAANRAEDQAREQRESAERAWAESRAQEKRQRSEPPADEAENAAHGTRAHETNERAVRARAEQAWLEERAQAERERAAEQTKIDDTIAERAGQAWAEQARAERARAERARAEQARVEQARVEQARAEQARAEQARAEPAKGESAATSRVDRPMQPMVLGPGKQAQKPYLPSKQIGIKKPALHPGIWAALGVLFLAAGMLGTWWEIRDSVQHETLPETPVPQPVDVHAAAPPAPQATPVDEPAVVPEPGAEAVVVEGTAVEPTPATVPPPVAVAPPPPVQTEKPNSNPMEKPPLAERPVVVADRPATSETTAKATAKATAKTDAPPQIRPGVLRVTSTTPAKVYVDGKAFGQVEKDVTIELAPGVHDVKLVSQKGGRSQTQRVRVDSGGAIMLSFEFK